MNLVVEETDSEGRAIYFKSPADISKAVTFGKNEISTQERVNELFERKKTPTAKFCGFVYSFAPFLTICSSNSSGKQKVKQRIDYKTIKGIYPCEADSNVLFIVTHNEKSKPQLRVLRLPSDAKATQLRYIIDQLQLTPLYKHEQPDKINRKSHSTTVSGYSSLDHEAVPRKCVTPAVSERPPRAPVQATLQYCGSEAQYYLPRVHKYAPASVTESRPLSRQTQTMQRPPPRMEMDDFDDIRIYRPKLRVNRPELYNKGGSEGRRRPPSRMQRRRLEGSTSSSDWSEDDAPEDEDSGFSGNSRFRSDNNYSRKSRLQDVRQGYARPSSVPPRRYRVLN